MYIIFEGVDTCGKSTQIDILKERYPDIVVTKEPGGTSFGEKVRRLLLEGDIHSSRAELLLFLADRAENYEEVVKPARNRIVISDRGFLSGIGYALASGGAELEELIALNHFALYGDWPEHIVFFKTDEETLSERIGAKNLDNIESRGVKYLLEVQKHMLIALEKLSIPCLIIDASDKIDRIHDKITNYLEL